MDRHRALLIALTLICSAVCLRAQEPTEGYIVTPDKVRIFYKIEGTGPETLVIVHGGPGNSLESVRPDFAPFAKNRRVIYYDQRGNGRSDLIADEKKLGVEFLVADLEALRQHFKLEKMTLLGNSWGGLMASLYAVAHPDRIERMVLDSSAPPIRPFLDDLEDEIARRMKLLYKPEQLQRVQSGRKTENWLKAADPAAHCREVFTLLLTVYTYKQSLDGLNFKGDVCSGSKEAVLAQRAVNAAIWRSLGEFDLMPKLPSVKAPVLVIHGAADVIPRRSSEFWAFGYPNARMLLIEKAGHMAQVETPEIFFPAVETFLKGSFPAEAKKVERQKW